MQQRLESAIAFLEERGFVNKRQNLRLLKRANFDALIVANFLTAKKALLEAENKVIESKNVPVKVTLKINVKQDQPTLVLDDNKPNTEVEKKKLSKEERIARIKQRLVNIAAKINRLQRLLANSDSLSDEEIARKQKRLVFLLARQEKVKCRLCKLEEKCVANKFPAKIGPKVSAAFIDASTLDKSQEQVLEIARTMLSNNVHITKCTILYNNEIAPLKEEKIVVANVMPIFSSTEQAINAMVQNKMTTVILTGNKPWMEKLRNDGYRAFSL